MLLLGDRELPSHNLPHFPQNAGTGQDGPLDASRCWRRRLLLSFSRWFPRFPRPLPEAEVEALILGTKG
jgi:hypothetical protein